MNQKIERYIEATIGPGNYYSSRLVLLDKLKKTRRPRWAGIPVPEFIEILERSLKAEGINTDPNPSSSQKSQSNKFKKLNKLEKTA